MIQIAVIGIGHVGFHHARILSTDPRVHLAGIVDIDEQKKQFAQQFHTTYYPSYEKITSPIDAVVIASPTSTHASITEFCLKKGIHCFVEKSFTHNLAAAKNLVHIASDNNLILQVGLIEKFNPAFTLYKNFINQPSFIEIHRTHPFINRCLDVDVVTDLMIHDLDLLCELFTNSIIDIQTSAYQKMTQFIDSAYARITYANNCICDITASRVSNRSMRKMNILQSDGYYSLNFAEQSLTVCQPCLSQLHDSIEFKTVTLKKEKQELLPAELDTFIKALLSHNTNVTNSGKQALKSLELAFIIKNSIEASLAELIR